MTGPVTAGGQEPEAKLAAAPRRACPAPQTNAPRPVMARPTISVLISRVPS